MYNFLFDKKSLVLLLSGAGVAGGVLFFAGVLVGVQWGLPFETAPVAAPVRPAPKRAALQTADRPCKPVPEAAPAAPPQPVTVPDLFPQPEKRAAAAPAPEPAPVQPAPEPPAAFPAPATVAAVAVTRAPEPAPAEPKASPEPQAEGPGRYALQIGAFRDPKNSEKVIQELQAKGYEPYVVEQKGRSLLRIVRIGRYADRAEALRAASELRRREGLEAIVRPI
ncbi:MAG TPA: SPOR domain-containing protein [Thermoanaerobaculia bacterium]